MLTLSQIILVIVVTILSILLIIFSIYIFLEELKKTLQKTNSMMDDMKRITKSVADPIEHASEFISGLKKGAKLVELAGELVSKKQEHDRRKK